VIREFVPVRIIIIVIIILLLRIKRQVPTVKKYTHDNLRKPINVQKA